jgi:RNA polymerase sigma-70 factor (ECF subfamily)
MQVNHFHNVKDEVLMAQYRESGNKELVGILFKRYATLIYGLCFKYLRDEAKAEDAVIDIFEILLDKLREVEVSYFKSWLYIVARNHVLLLIRKAGRQSEVSLDEMTEKNPDGFMEIADEDTLNIETDSIQIDDSLVQEAIQSLKPAQQVCIDCFFIKGMSYQQTAQHTGFDIKEVKSHLQNGKRNLKIYLESKGYTYG